MTDSQIDIASKILENTHTVNVHGYEIRIVDMLNRKKVLQVINNGMMTVIYRGSCAECLSKAKDFLALL